MDWFRTDTGFTTHRDSVRLRKVLGLSRLAMAGHMLLLFEAVAKHEEYGDLSKTQPEVIEEWADWPHDRAGEFDRALRETGWITAEGKFSGWYDRHKQLLEAREEKKKWREKKKAEARKANKGNDKGRAPRPRTVQDGPRLSTDSPRPSETIQDRPSNRTVPDRTVPDDVTTSVGSPPTADRVDELFARWNELAAAHGLPRAEKVTPKRREAAKARIAEGLLDRWLEFAAALPKSRHHMGHNDRGWKADPEWLLRRDAWLGVIERAKAAAAPAPSGPAPETFEEFVRRVG